MILHHVLLNTRTGDVRAGCDVVHSGSKNLVDSVPFLFKASLHNPVDRGIQTTTIFHFWSSNSAQPSSRPYIMQTCDCLHYHVFTCVVRLTHMFHVWVPRRRLYDSSALHIVGGNYTHFPPVPSIALVSLRSLRLKRLQTRVRPNFYCLGIAICTHLHLDSMFYTHSLPQYVSDWLGSLVLPTGRAFSFLLGLREVPYFTSWPWFPVSRPDPRGFLQEKLRLRLSLVLFYAAIGIYHWIFFAMLYTLRKNFHQSTSVASYWQKTDIIHMNSKAWL